jgi:hypothetical protein
MAGAVLGMACVGSCAGLTVSLSNLLPWEETTSVKGQRYPLPHQIPKYAKGISLRFAMMHDVIHERFPRHGKAYYAERNRLVRLALKKAEAGFHPKGELSDSYLALLDDLGAGLDFLGEHDEAVRVLRDKLTKQEGLGHQGRKLYTTYANLGTFLIHGNFRKAGAGDARANELLREGLALIHKAIAVNPEAHFGREIWQAVTVEFLLAAIENPKLLVKYDLVGNRLDETIDFSRAGSFAPRHFILPPRYTSLRDYLSLIQKDASEEQRAKARRHYITHVGAAREWTTEVKSSHRQAVAFDESALGIIGMWRLGGGANPHFALALGEIAVRVGQFHIAWCAYERAVRLADRVVPDPQIRQQFVEHCRRRQGRIEEHLPNDTPKELRSRFEAELAHGLRYQQSYQRYEEERIKKGASLDDPHFYDAFFAEHGQIASPIGNADTFVVTDVFMDHDFLTTAHDDPEVIPWPSIVLFAGVFAFATACWLRWKRKRLRRIRTSHSEE